MSLIGTTATFTIDSSGTVSNAVDLGDRTLVGLQLPTMTGTAITFQASTSLDGTYVAVKGSDGASISYTTASSTYVAIQPAVLAGIRFIKIVSGSAEGAARTVTGVARQCA